MNNIMKLIFLLLLILFIPFSYSNGIWTYAEDIKAGVFGEREGLTDDDNYTFNNIVYFNRNIFANESATVRGNIISNRLVSFENSSFFIEPFGVSNLHRIVVNRIFSPGTNAYYLNPAGLSILQDLRVDSEIIYQGSSLEDIFVNRDGDTMTGDLNIYGDLTAQQICSSINPNICVDFNEFIVPKSLALDILMTVALLPGTGVIQGISDTRFHLTGSGVLTALDALEVLLYESGSDPNTATREEVEATINLWEDLQQPFLNRFDGIMQGDLDLDGNNINMGNGNINQVDTINVRELCSEDGENCFELADQSSGFSSNIFIDALVVSSRDEDWTGGPSSAWGYSFDLGNNQVTSSQIYDLCFLTTTLFPTIDDAYVMGGGCELNKNTNGTWTLTAHRQKRVSAYCAAACIG